MVGPAHANTTLVLVGLLFTIVLAGIDTTVVSTAMPVALKELGGANLYAWTFAAYMLATAITMPIWGPGSDRWGRKRTYLIGVAVFVAGSLLCAVAPSMTFFIAARALQGAGAGAVSSLPFIVLGVIFPPEKRGKALGIVSSAWAVASVAGPLLGTAIVTHASWRWVFLINLPVGLAASALVARGMSESVGDRGGRFDALGSALAGAGGAALIWAFVRLGESPADLFDATLVLVGLGALALFTRHEARAANPILPLAFFRHRGYAMAMAAGMLTFFTGFGLASYLPLEASAVFGTATAVGVIVGAFTIGWSLAAFTAGRVVHRAGERLLGILGVSLHVVAFAWLTVAFSHGLAVAAAATALAGVGVGIASPGLTVAVQNSVEVRRMGSATTSQQFVRQVGAALGVTSFVLAASLAGWRGGLSLMAIVALVALAFCFALPATSLPAKRAEGATETD